MDDSEEKASFIVNIGFGKLANDPLLTHFI